MARASDIQRCRAEQRICVEELLASEHVGAALGLADWFMEELLIEQEALPPIIGLTGHMGSGKDTAGDILKKLGYERRAFADELKQEVEYAIKYGFLPDQMPDKMAAYFITVKPEDVRKKPTRPAMRAILQWWGTEYRRSQDKDYWVKQTAGSLNGGRYVFTDVRFPNEAALIRQRGGPVWRIERATTLEGIPGHASEQILPVDRIIDNTRDITWLERQILAALHTA